MEGWDTKVYINMYILDKTKLRILNLTVSDVIEDMLILYFIVYNNYTLIPNPDESVVNK